MAHVPEPVAEFLRGRRIAVAGVSRGQPQPANSIFRKLRDAGYETFPVNPRATEVEGVTCYPDLAAIPGPLDGVVVSTHPDLAVELVRQAAERGTRRIWLHRSFGQGSVSDAAVGECAARGITCLTGGCPLMYVEPVDIFHRCFRWWLRWRGRVPG